REHHARPPPRAGGPAARCSADPGRRGGRWAARARGAPRRPPLGRPGAAAGAGPRARDRGRAAAGRRRVEPARRGPRARAVKRAALARADRVVVLVDGEVAEVGPWDRLAPRWAHLAG